MSVCVPSLRNILPAGLQQWRWRVLQELIDDGYAAAGRCMVQRRHAEGVRRPEAATCMEPQKQESESSTLGNRQSLKSLWSSLM